MSTIILGLYQVSSSPTLKHAKQLQLRIDILYAKLATDHLQWYSNR
jgi:hypothetical protein